MSRPMCKAEEMARTGETFTVKNDLQNAIACFDEGIKAFEDSPEANPISQQQKSWLYANRGNAYASVAFNRSLILADGDTKEFCIKAEADFDAAVDSAKGDPNNAWAWAHLGEFCRNHICSLDVSSPNRKMFMEKGLAAFEKATSIDERYAWAYSHWGTMLANARTDFKGALDQLHKAQNLYGDKNAWVYGNQMVCYYQMGDMSKAFYALFMSISIAPEMFNDGMLPAAQLTQDMSYSNRDLFMWALRAYLGIQALAKAPENSTGILTGLYTGFLNYSTLVQKVYSYLADKDDNVEHLRSDLDTSGIFLPPDTNSDWCEIAYRIAGLQALASQVFPDTGHVMRDRAVDLCKNVLDHCQSTNPRDSALIQIIIRDPTFYSYKDLIVPSLKRWLPQ